MPFKLVARYPRPIDGFHDSSELLIDQLNRRRLPNDGMTHTLQSDAAECPEPLLILSAGAWARPHHVPSPRLRPAQQRPHIGESARRLVAKHLTHCWRSA